MTFMAKTFASPSLVALKVLQLGRIGEQAGQNGLNS